MVLNSSSMSYIETLAIKICGNSLLVVFAIYRISAIRQSHVANISLAVAETCNGRPQRALKDVLRFSRLPSEQSANDQLEECLLGKEPKPENPGQTGLIDTVEQQTAWPVIAQGHQVESYPRLLSRSSVSRLSSR